MQSSPEVYDDLLGLLHVQGLSQMFNFTPAVGLVVVADMTYHSCVMGAVVGQQSEEPRVAAGVAADPSCH